MNATRFVSAILLSIMASGACAGECVPRLRDGWIRLAPNGMTMPMLAGFGLIENPCAQPVAVVGASSPAFGDVSLHRTSIVDGMSRMRLVSELPIAAGDAALLAPGGLHLMLMQPATPIKAGTKVSVTFLLRDGREIPGVLEARDAAP